MACLVRIYVGWSTQARWSSILLAPGHRCGRYCTTKWTLTVEEEMARLQTGASDYSQETSKHVLPNQLHNHL